jgi:hypothetical protein
MPSREGKVSNRRNRSRSQGVNGQPGKRANSPICKSGAGSLQRTCNGVRNAAKRLQRTNAGDHTLSYRDYMKVPRQRIPRSLKAAVHARAVERKLKKALRAKARRRSSVPRRFTIDRPSGRPVEQRYGPPPYVLPETSVTVPAGLDFGECAIETLQFFRHLRGAISQHGRKAIFVDHSELQRLSPEAGLVLVAEMYRSCHLFRESRKVCSLPDDPRIRDLLGEVGYYNYFRRAEQLWSPSVQNRGHFLAHQKGTKLEPRVVKSLMQHFASAATLESDMSSALYAALIECMNNVLEHAYPAAAPHAADYRLWWILSYVDPRTRKISFCFFDQGVGIPSTIRTRLRDAPWLGPLARSDSELVQTAVIRGGYSSTKLISKGRGLPTLKRFIDNAPDGELSIVTHKSICTFHTNQRPSRADGKISLPGTLIAWNIRQA